jgi:hypothetical protein
MVGSGRRLLRACVLIALMAAVGGNQRQQQALLQGAQDQAVMRGFFAPKKESMLGKRSPAEREEYISQIEDAEFAAMRDMMAVSQALQGEVSPRVKVEVYTAAGCGECRKVFHAAISKVLQKEGMLNIVDLNMVLWGDGDVLDPNGAKVSMTPGTQFPPTVSFSCRTHGDHNCDGNAWESCLMSKYPDEGAYFPVLNCIEGRACAGIIYICLCVCVCVCCGMCVCVCVCVCECVCVSTTCTPRSLSTNTNLRRIYMYMYI